MRLLGGRYRLDQQIGSGGMAHVWSAHDTVLDRPVAIKLLTEDHTADPSAFERAHNEARCAARLAHPNVAAVYDFGTSRRSGQGAAYLVMELLEGSLLSVYLHRGPLHCATAVRVCAEISAGLAASHSHGIVHRDIKPSNIILTQSGAKILDFGIAARTGEIDRLPDGRIEGTAAYMAPERLDTGPVAPALDLYSLGLILYRSLTGTLPAHLATDRDVLRSPVDQGPPELPPITGLAPEAAQICLACLDPDPANRPTATAAALVLAASVDTQVYLPAIPRPQPLPTPAHTDADLHAATMKRPL